MGRELIPFPNDARRAPLSAPVAVLRPGGALPPHERDAAGEIHNRPDRFGQVSIFYIGRRLGRPRASAKALLPLIRALIDQRGHPLPLDVRVQNGRLVEGAAAVRADSRWSHAEWLAWFDHYRPAAARAEAEAEQGAWGDRLDAAARALVA